LNCPDCKTPVDFSRKSCPRCKVLYQEAFESRAWAALKKPKKRRQPARLAKKHKVFAGVLVLAAAAALVYQFLPAPEGLAPLPGAVASARGFAVAAPASWTADFSELDRGGRLSAARLSDGTTAVEILVAPELVFQRARQAAGAAELASLEFNGDEVRLESFSELEIDRLPAVRLTVAGGRTYLPSPNAGKALPGLAQPAPRYESLEFGGQLIAIPGGGCSYLVKITSSRDELLRQKRLLDGLLGSLRITRRPRLAAL